MFVDLVPIGHYYSGIENSALTRISRGRHTQVVASDPGFSLFGPVRSENRQMLRSCSSQQNYQRNVRYPATVFLLLTVLIIQKVSAARSFDSMTASIIESPTETGPVAPFYSAVTRALKKRKFKLEQVCPATDATARRILEDYGAIFLVTKDVKPPPVCVFLGEDAVAEFQQSAGYVSETIEYSTIELQPAAMKAYLKARDEAIEAGLDITPRGGPEAARRTYTESEELWNSRFLPALEYWTAQGRMTAEQASQIRAMPLKDQINEVLKLEKEGVFFSKDFSKSILYSIAAPGASQHLAMLALDVTEFQDDRVRAILARHGWFQTVLSDLPHFTYLGLKEKDLPKQGLKNVEVNGQIFWIPNVEHTEPLNP